MRSEALGLKSSLSIIPHFKYVRNFKIYLSQFPFSASYHEPAKRPASNCPQLVDKCRGQGLNPVQG